MLRRGDLVLQVLQQQADAQGRGEGLQVLDRGERALDGGLVPGGIAQAEVEAKRMLGIVWERNCGSISTDCCRSRSASSSKPAPS